MKIEARPRLQAAISKYREARKSLTQPVSARSRRGLDWMNFFLSDVQTSFGSFVAFYLATLQWSKQDVGFALMTGGLAGVLCMAPGGALADTIPWKRLLAGTGIAMLGGAALILALHPTMWLVFAAETLHGLTAGIIGPAISAISLGLVGRSAMSARTGRNQRFQAAGTALTAGLMGLIGHSISQSAIFVATAAFCIPALIALSFIRPEEIDYRRARNARKDDKTVTPSLIADLGKNRGLLVFAGCVILFQLSDASMLPMVSEELALGKGDARALYMSALVIAPQVTVALLAPWVGYHSERHGRKPLLLIGFGAEIIRALLFMVVSSAPFLIAIQVLDGLSGAIVTVLTILVVTDLTAGTGRFNLARGVVGMLVGIAGSVSLAANGFLFTRYGNAVGFLVIAAIAAAATAFLWMFMPETKPAEYGE
jgi:MFS family permease